MTTAKDVAAWMVSELDTRKELYQEDVVYEIARRFGEQFTYMNENGNPAVARPVLKEFRKFTGDDVVWFRDERYWRRREPSDAPGRQQD